MKIAVYLGSSEGNAAYMDLAVRTGQWIGSQGHTLVYGGSDRGMMGALAQGVHAGHGRIIGVMPSFMVEKGWDQKGLDQMIVTANMAERRLKMMELADGYIALPGGVGTLDEISEVISGEKLGIVQGEIVLMNYHDFYKPQLQQLKKMCTEGFYPEVYLEKIHAVNDVADLDGIFASEGNL